MDYSKDTIPSLISHIHTLAADFTGSRLSTKAKLVSSHGFILYLLSREGRLTKSEIAERINRNRSTTTVLLRKLLDEKYIKETVDKNDNRKKYISLTEKGKKTNAMTSAISSELQEACWKNFTEAEKENLLKLLCKVNDNLEKEIMQREN